MLPLISIDEKFSGAAVSMHLQKLGIVSAESNVFMVERRCGHPGGDKLALERRFGRHGGVKLALERHVGRSGSAKLALEQRFGHP